MGAGVSVTLTIDWFAIRLDATTTVGSFNSYMPYWVCRDTISIYGDGLPIYIDVTTRTNDTATSIAITISMDTRHYPVPWTWCVGVSFVCS